MPKNKRSSLHVTGNDAKFGLKVISRDAKTGAVNGLQCRFCISFGREEKVGAKRKVKGNVQAWSAPFRYDNIEGHVRDQHADKFEEFLKLDTQAQVAFFEDIVPFRNMLTSHFEAEGVGKRAIVFNIDRDIVDVVVKDMMYAPQDDLESGNDDSDESSEEEQRFGSKAELEAYLAKRRLNYALAKQKALDIFKRNEIQASHNDVELDFNYTITIPKTKTTVFSLATRYVSCGASFRMAANCIGKTYEIMKSPSLRSCSRRDVSSYARVVCAINLQRMKDLLKRTWAFSLALDSATHDSTSYLDIRVRYFDERSCSIVNLHACALPMFDRHTGRVMFDMVAKFLGFICPDWRIRLLGATSDGARNMTGRVEGTLSYLESSLLRELSLIRMWCGGHQLDLVMEHVMNRVVKESFLDVLTAFISHLGRQQTLIADMGTTAPRLVNRWLSANKVTSWFKKHRPALLRHIETKQPRSSPPLLWWVYLLAMDCFTSLSAKTFCKIQGLSTLVAQQQVELDDLVASFAAEVQVEGPLTESEVNALDPTLHVLNGCFAVKVTNVLEFVAGLSDLVDDILALASEDDRDRLLRDIGLVFVVASDQINKISTRRNADNSPFCADQNSIPPVLPHELVTVSAANFLRCVRKQRERLEYCYPLGQVDAVCNQHKELLRAYRSENVLRAAIESVNNNTLFEVAWGTLAARFPDLAEFCGGIATVFPGTCTVEADFSVLRWEKNRFRKGLSDFGLESVLQTKQYLAIESLTSSD
jgi:hypothetical protein